MKKKYTRSLVAGLALTTCLAVASSAWADLRVNVMPSGITGHSDTWDSDPYTWPDNTLALWGNVVYDGGGTLTYTWDFGASEGSISGTVADRNNIATSHAYPNGSFLATLTVTDGTETDTDTVEIDVVPQTLGVEKNLAIQKGLRYQYQTRVSALVNGEQGYYWDGGAYAATDAALAVLAFENHGHLGRNDADEDIYAETVQGGLNYMFYYGQCTGAVVSPTYTDSDINGNDEKCYIYTNRLYDVGITTMAIAGSASPGEIVGAAGSASLAGKTYQELLEDMVDYIAYAQEDRTYAPGYGGWRYTPNYYSADNSVTQWPVLALGEAERAPWNINAPAYVKTRMASWLDSSSQASNGGFGYSSATYYANVAKTGAGIAGLAYAGLTDVTWNDGTKLSKAIEFLNTYWDTNNGGYLYHYNLGYHYATYAVKKGMEFADQPLVGTHDWQEEYDQWYVDHQNADGSWNNAYWISTYPTNTAFSLLVLAPLEVCKPLADAGVDQEEGEGAIVVLDGTGSTTSCPDTTIVSYEWDCDYDGVTFTLDDTGAIGECVYAITNSSDTQLFTVALRVTDDQTKTDIDTATITVTNGNVAPVADPGGPYSAAVGADITLDGSASYDVNACDPALGLPCLDDFIASFQWDLDGDGLFGSEDSPAEPEGISPLTNFGAFIGTKTIGLKVTDSFDRSAAQSADVTTVALSDLYPESYELISNIYNRRNGMWTVTWKMNIINVGTAPGTDVSAEWTPTSIPVGVTLIDDTVSWTDPDNIIDAGEIQLSGDADATFSYTYSRTVNPPDLTQITWDISFTDNLGTRHIIRSILQ